MATTEIYSDVLTIAEVVLDDNTTLVFLRHQNSVLEGRIETKGPIRKGWVDFFATRPPRHGMGRKIMEAYVVALKQNGVDELWSCSISPEALGLRVKLFGAEALNFYDDSDPEHRLLPINLEQAIESNNRIAYQEMAGEDSSQSYLGAYVDISKIDTTGWQQALVIS